MEKEKFYVITLHKRNIANMNKLVLPIFLLKTSLEDVDFEQIEKIYDEFVFEEKKRFSLENKKLTIEELNVKFQSYLPTGFEVIYFTNIDVYSFYGER